LKQKQTFQPVVALGYRPGVL